MIIARNHADVAGQRLRRDLPIFQGYRTDFITTEGEGLTPQAFLVQQDPHFCLRTHYHQQHQFQVVASGSGTLGSHELTPFAVHYSSPESGYGPIVAGPEGLGYLTLRLVMEMGAHMLPDERQRMQRGLRKRQRMADAPALAAPQQLRERQAVAVEPLFPDDAMGLAAWFVRLPPGGSTVVEGAALGGGRFHIVARGSMQVDGRQLEPLGVTFTTPEETGFALRAGDAGLEVLVVQFPRDAAPQPASAQAAREREPAGSPAY